MSRGGLHAGYHSDSQVWPPAVFTEFVLRLFPALALSRVTVTEDGVHIGNWIY
jgi:hypothetical protein